MGEVNDAKKLISVIAATSPVDFARNSAVHALALAVDSLNAYSKRSASSGLMEAAFLEGKIGLHPRDVNVVHIVHVPSGKHATHAPY